MTELTPLWQFAVRQTENKVYGLLNLLDKTPVNEHTGPLRMAGTKFLDELHAFAMVESQRRRYG